MIEIIETYKATISFTSPTAYRAMMAAMDGGADLSSLRMAVSAGETLPAPVFEEWARKTGKPILDGIGSTELLHIFITNRLGDAKAGATGKPVTGYEAKIVDDDMKDVPDGTVGHLAVRGPTGCRYLADDRQTKYVRDGWNLTGDDFVRDEEGVFHFMARADDMIISSGYNIAGPEVEAALLSHPAVAECAVVGAPDAERGQIVEAHVVLREGVAADEATVRALQDHVKATIAPYKYPRSVKFVGRPAQDADRQDPEVQAEAIAAIVGSGLSEAMTQHRDALTHQRRVIASLDPTTPTHFASAQSTPILASDRSTPMKIKIVVHEARKAAFWAEVPAIPGCATQGETMEDAPARRAGSGRRLPLGRRG